MAKLIFYAGGRRRKLYRRRTNGPFHVRFQFQGKDIVRSLGTTVESAAKEIAKQHIEAAVKGDREESRRLKVRSDYCTPRQVCDIYAKKFGTDERRRRTANGNVSSLGKILRLGAGLALADCRMTVLSGELIRKFEAAEEKRIEIDAAGNMNQDSERRVRESICSVVRQARSIFKKPTMNWYEELALPDLTKFREQGVTAPDRPKPRRMDEAVIEQVNAAAPALAVADPACYMSHLLFKYLGMRNREQKFSRRSWIVRDIKGGGGRLGVIYRPEEGFKPKKKTERWIPITATVLAQIDRYWKESPDGDYLVPAEHKTEREEIIDRKHSAWAGQWIKGHTKVSYELRRYAGSLIYKKTGRIEHVQAFLGHADLKTTLEWYWYLLDETPGIDMEDCPDGRYPEIGCQIRIA